MELRISGPCPALRGEHRPPGDKSVSHRALLLASFADGPSRLLGFLRAGVTEAMLDCMRALGADVEFISHDDLLVIGRPWSAPSKPLNCRNSGATMRMLLGALAPQPICTTLDGSSRLRQRPMGRVVEPLLAMGADIRAQGAGHQPPLVVHGGRLHGIDYRLPVPSAQVKTAILFAALSAEGRTRLQEPGPSRDHTERILQSQGVAIRFGNLQVDLNPDERRLPAFTLRIPGDFSSASFPMAASLAIPESAIRIRGVGINPTRTGLLDTFQEMGADIQLSERRQEGREPVADMHIRGGGLRAVDISGDRVVRMIDEFPIFAVAATQAKGESTVRDALELRHKESDRIAALVEELRKMGAQIEERPDGFAVAGPTRLRAARLKSHGDHRLAMALTVAGLLAQGQTTIAGAECIHESFPSFLESLASLGAQIA
jgi:3-phosphoshikimate 1-carboxyvinyltransferase